MSAFYSWNDYCRDQERTADGFGSEDYWERVDMAMAERDND